MPGNRTNLVQTSWAMLGLMLGGQVLMTKLIKRNDMLKLILIYFFLLNRLQEIQLHYIEQPSCWLMHRWKMETFLNRYHQVFFWLPFILDPILISCIFVYSFSNWSWYVCLQEITGVYMKNCILHYPQYRNIFSLWALAEYRKRVWIIWIFLSYRSKNIDRICKSSQVKCM